MNQGLGDREQETGNTTEPELPTPVSCPLSPGDASRSPRSKLPLALLVGLVAAVVGFAVWYLALRGPRNDLERLEGDWGVAAGGRNPAVAVRVSGDRWEYVGGRAYRITLSESANPKVIDLDPLDIANIRGPKPRLHGIYAFDGDTVRVRLGPATEPRPTTLDDPDATVLVLTRLKLEPAPQVSKP